MQIKGKLEDLRALTKRLFSGLSGNGNNSSYKFDIGDILELKSETFRDMGINPIATVLERGNDQYKLNLVRIVCANTKDYLDWVKTGEIPSQTRKEEKEKKYTKKTIEKYFKKVGEVETYRPGNSGTDKNVFTTSDCDRTFRDRYMRPSPSNGG